MFLMYAFYINYDDNFIDPLFTFAEFDHNKIKNKLITLYSNETFIVGSRYSKKPHFGWNLDTYFYDNNGTLVYDFDFSKYKDFFTGYNKAKTLSELFEIFPFDFIVRESTSFNECDGGDINSDFGGFKYTKIDSI